MQIADLEVYELRDLTRLRNLRKVSVRRPTIDGSPGSEGIMPDARPACPGCILIGKAIRE